MAPAPPEGDTLHLLGAPHGIRHRAVDTQSALLITPSVVATAHRPDATRPLRVVLTPSLLDTHIALHRALVGAIHQQQQVLLCPVVDTAPRLAPTVVCTHDTPLPSPL